MATAATPSLPQWLTSWLGVLNTGLIILAVIWLVLAVWGWYRRRSYNLTVVESARARGLTPDFLRPQQTSTAPAATTPPPRRPLERLSRIAVVLFALANLITAASGAIARIDTLQSRAEWFYRLSTGERGLTILAHYWFGIGVALLVIIVEALRSFGLLRRLYPPNPGGR